MSTFVGINFPFKTGSVSFPQEASDNDLIKQSLVQLILVGKGERVMRPDVGSNAYQYVFENNDDVLGELIRSEITGVIGKFEPRVALQNVEAIVDSKKNTVTIKILYIVRLNAQSDSLTLTIPKV